MNFSPTTFILYIYKIILKNNFKGKYRLLNTIKIFIPDKINLLDKYSGIKLQVKREDPITNYLLIKKSYEPITLLKANELLVNSKGVFIDIGANFGLFSCLLAKFATKTISIEPSPYSMCTLIKNINLNNLNNEIIPVLGLLSSQKNIFAFYNNPNNQGGSRINYGKYKSDFFINSCSINDILDKFLDINQKISLIKIDIEGQELDLLQDFNFAKYDPENIIMEYEPLNNINVKNIIKIANSKGYYIYNIDGSRFAGTPKIECNIWLSKIKISN
jgi:FkbM family methyltransferase